MSAIFSQIAPAVEINFEFLWSNPGGVRYGSQTNIFKARSSQDQNYDGREEC